MITDEESDVIVRRAFEYIIALFEFILSFLTFQLNHHLYQGFKDAIQGPLISRMDKIEWKELDQNDPLIDERFGGAHSGDSRFTKVSPVRETNGE